MEYQRFLTSTRYSGSQVLADWRWLIGPDLQLLHATKAGDALLLDPNDASIHFLDTASGRVQRIADNESEFESLLSVRANVDRFLMADVVNGQSLLGMRPGEDECLSYKHPPALGGQLDPDNFEVCDVAVHFSIAGQLHRQIKDLPPGTPIDDLRIEATGLERRRPWWKFW